MKQYLSSAMKLKVTGLVLAMGGLGYSVPAAAETVNCVEITSIPTTISTQGVYCLKKHLSNGLASGAAINVTVNNVTIDCNHYKLGNLAAGPATSASGVVATGRTNVTVRNCGIRGYRVGVDLANGEYRVFDNRFDSNTQIGIRVTGTGSVVSGNEVVDTGGSTVANVNHFYGIYTEGNADIIDNIVNNVVATAGGKRHAYGIRGSNMNAVLVQGNRVAGLAPTGLAANRYGITIEDGYNNTVRDNTVVMGSGLVSGDVGIRCGNSLLGLLGGVATGNVVMQAGLLGTVGALLNCTAIFGGNYVSI